MERVLRESEAVDAVCKHVSKEGGVGVEGGEVGVHVRGLPVGHPRHDHLKLTRFDFKLSLN